MIPLSVLSIAQVVAAMRIMVATLPSGDIERIAFLETEDGAQVTIERSVANTDVTTQRHQFIRRGRYTWRIDEERRTVLMAPIGRPTGVIRRVFSVSGSYDASRRATDAPRPVEAFRFYAPTREAAELLQSRLRRALR